jgi:hypothetical protein
MIPKTGRVHVILDPVKPPELTPSEVAHVIEMDKPNSAMTERIESIAEAAGSVIRAKSLKPRPEGKTDPARGRLFGYGMIAVLALAIGMTVRQRKAAATA